MNNKEAARILGKAKGNKNISDRKILKECAILLGKQAGKIGGIASAEKLSAEQRRERARKAAMARWHP